MTVDFKALETWDIFERGEYLVEYIRSWTALLVEILVFEFSVKDQCECAQLGERGQLPE